MGKMNIGDSARKRNRRVDIRKFLVFMLILLITAGCGAAKEEGQAKESDQADIKIGMVTDIGGLKDNSFNEISYEGLQRLAKDTGVTIKAQESKSQADYDANLSKFIQANYNLTWGIGFLMGDTMKKVAAANPNQNFGIVDFAYGPDTPKNLASVTFKEHEGSYLVGYIAGKTTKTNKVGFIGGMELDLIKKFQYGYMAGVKAANPDAQVIVNYVGDFNKAAEGKTFAATQYDKGVDIIYHAAGATGDGVFGEAAERKKAGQDVWVIGVDKDQSVRFGNEITLTSMVKRVDNAVYTISRTLIDGNFPGGTNTELGLKEDGVGIAPTSEANVPKNILDEVNQIRERIINGEIQVPYDEATFKS